ncbi:urea amidolyase associated protein UAAP1 [Paenibacillus massiliensis]|uniref:urea amidolyase associated protein UAAP1 n=1 Tax=Paenibacillus massiliensis TaxID=225917 RepID=UPI00040B416D|nr:urea amidolyase associated protein UAAP1 [Paenibacillus massiliensis]
MTALFTMTMQPGSKWSAHVGRGKAITLTATGDRANVSALLFHAQDPAERYNMPDTLKAQHTAYLTTGNVLMSDQGRVLASITEDTVGWHDPLSGYTTREATDQKYGITTYQDQRNDWLRSGEENFKVELFRHQLSPRDIAVPVNFFSKVVCELDGTMKYTWQETAARSVTIRTEMDILLVLSNTPHPLDPSAHYPNTSVIVSVTDVEPASEEDPCVLHCGENQRAFENTWNAFALLKGAN